MATHQSGEAHLSSIEEDKEQKTSSSTVPTSTGHAPGKKAVQRLHSSCQVTVEQSSAEPEVDLKALEKATFRDTRWQNALQHLQASGKPREASAQYVVRQGAKSFGIWHLAEASLSALALHLDEGTPQVSPALQAWIDELQSGDGPNNPGLSNLAEREAVPSKSSFKGTQERLKAHRRTLSPEAKVEIVLALVVLILSNLYALEVVLHKYPGVIGLFGWPIYVARAGGCGALLWTALIFLTMSRTVMCWLMACLPLSCQFYRITDSHKELHIFCGKMLVYTGLLHICAHCIGTVPGIERSKPEDLNALLGCANRETTPGYINAPMPGLMAPKCPIEREYTYMEVLFTSMPGLTGLALTAIIGAVAYTARAKGRTQKFDIFWYVHNAAMVLWLVFLFLHGSNGWVGVGFPLVIPVCGLPVALYLVDRIRRAARYYLFTGKAVQVESVVIRAGKNDGPNGSLTHLSLSKPPYLWASNFRSGMYAFLCMPEYAPLQWHPFTVCSGEEDDTVDFIVAGLGDWTEELARRVLKFYADGGNLPLISLDGPYLSPTASALSHEVLIAVGAGVGVTPLLSLMSTIIAMLDNSRAHKQAGKHILPLKEAHFYWMTRSADELLFARNQFTRIVSSAKLRDKVFLHLHVTHKAADKDVSAYLFREAVRRQSEIDREAFREAARDLTPMQLIRGPQLPWCWVNGTKQDVLWVSSLVESADEDALAEAHADHWARGISPDIAGSADAAEEVPTEKIKTRRTEKKRKTGLFSAKTSSRLGEVSVPMVLKGLDAYLPVTLGRPDFAQEVRAIGKARPGNDVYVYICGNDALVKSLQEICDECNWRAQSAAEGGLAPHQKYYCHFERFG